MRTNLKLLMSTAAVAPIVFVLFAGSPAFAQCTGQQTLAQAAPSNPRGPLADPDRRDPHTDRFAQARPGDPDARDPHNDRFAQAGPGDPDARDPHNDRFAQSAGCK
jgi:hypothetical protein